MKLPSLSQTLLLAQCTISLALPCSNPSYLLHRDNSECPSSSRIVRELGPLLSKKAAILTPASAEWNELLRRSSAPRIRPVFVAAVDVAGEEDVQATIKYANHIGVPFLAVSGAHGWPETMNQLHGGIQINTRLLKKVEVNDDGNTATVGGGVLQYELVRDLYKQGKMGVTGLCECVSVVGPLLGGGHSMLQGLHGFAADNLVSARLVLANGSAVTVSSTSHAELFWAIRGAGHNFGLVTSLGINVYDARPTWSMVVFMFTQDNLESFFETWNELEATYKKPGLLVLNSFIARTPQVDAKQPIIILQLFHQGPNPTADAYQSAFAALGPVSTPTVVPGIEYKDIYRTAGLDISSPVCRKDGNLAGFPNSFSQWDPRAMRAGFDLFSEFTALEAFNTSAWILESYGREGVAAVPVGENAVAPEERSLHLLTSPLFWWDGEDAGERATALAYGQRIQTVIRGGGGGVTLPHAYVNYAIGPEPAQEVYGWDVARLARLRAVKKAYDPENRFGFYMPIV